MKSLVNYLSEPENYTFTANSTVLVGKNTYIRTIEHLMASFSKFGLSNILVKVDNEIPNIDGSALNFSKLILDAGIVEQSAQIQKIVINKKITVGIENQNEKYLYAEPFDGFEATMRINYPEPIFEQTYTFNPEKESFWDNRDKACPLSNLNR